MILITGGSGLVGGHLLWHLLQNNNNISAIKRATTNLEPLHAIFSCYTTTPEKYLSRVNWIEADLLDDKTIASAMKGITTVYHCAAVVSLVDDNGKMLDTNVIGTENIVNAALRQGVQKFCFVSSIAALGKLGNDQLVTENTIRMEDVKASTYSLSKYLSEDLVWKGITQGLPANIVNPGVILGFSGTNNGSSQLFSQVRKGLAFYTHGGSGYVDVRDVVKAMILLTESKTIGERFILVSENCSNQELLSWMAEGFNKTKPFIPINRTLLWTIGLISETLGAAFNFKPLIDRSLAKTASNRTYYSNQKIKDKTGMEFMSIERSVKETCELLIKSKPCV